MWLKSLIQPRQSNEIVIKLDISLAKCHFDLSKLFQGMKTMRRGSVSGISKQARNMLTQCLQFRHRFLKERLTPIHRVNRCPAIRKTDLLSFENLDKKPIKTLEFDARVSMEIHRGSFASQKPL